VQDTKDKAAALKQIRDEFKGNGSDTQRLRLRAAFERFPSISTIEARTCLDILHPAGRIQELREEGQQIVTHWVTVDTGARIKHRIANYLFVREVCHA
jgi:hypothetical protein